MGIGRDTWGRKSMLHLLWASVAGSYITSNDYPRSAVKQHHEGRIAVELTVDVSGALSNCTVKAGTGWPELDETTCQLLMQRAKFAPARDMQGALLGAVIEWRFVWTLSPEHTYLADLPPARELQLTVASGTRVPPHSTLDAIVSTEGRIEMCQAEDSYVSHDVGVAACNALRSSAAYPPLKDLTGKPMRYLHTELFRLAAAPSNPTPSPVK
jgi:TonB family protein